MLRARFVLLSVMLALASELGCGGNSRHESDDDSAAGRGGSGGHALGGTSGVGASGGPASGKGGTTGDTGGSGGRAPSAGSGGRAGAASNAGRAGSAGDGGGSAGRESGGRGGAEAGGPSEGGAPDAPNVDAMLSDLADATTSFCQAATSCCNGTPSAPADCEAFYTMHQDAIPAIKTGAVTIDAAALARCKAAYADGPDQCNLNALIVACSGIFKGHQGVGEPCFTVYDCDRSVDVMTCLITDTTPEQPIGTCEKTPHAQLNQPCSITCQTRDEDCSSTTYGFVALSDLAMCSEEDGLFCDFGDDGAFCHPIFEEGQPCAAASFDACGSTGQCDTVCKALHDRGEPCENGCYPQYSCIDGTCADPVWDSDSACLGYGPSPG